MQFSLAFIAVAAAVLPVVTATTPELTEWSPWQNDLHSTSDSVKVTATVTDDNIKAVRVMTRFPDGSVSAFEAAIETSSDGDVSTWEFDLDTSDGAGKYGYKVRMRDSDQNFVLDPEDDFIEFVVADDAGQIVELARTAIDARQKTTTTIDEQQYMFALQQQQQQQQQQQLQCATPSLDDTTILTMFEPDLLKEKMTTARSDDSECLHYACDWDLDRCSLADWDDNYSFAANPDNKPPCCTAILRQLNRLFDAEMCNLGLGASGSAGDYVMLFGSLLGAVRHDGVIPWSNDNDYVLKDTTISAMLHLWNAERSGMTLIHDGLYRMCVNEHFMGGALKEWELTGAAREEQEAKRFVYQMLPYIDMYVGTDRFSSKKKDDELYFAFQPRCCFPRSDIWPSHRARIGEASGKSFVTNLPAEPITVLNGLYGKGLWEIPDAGHSKHGGDMKSQSVCERVQCKGRGVDFSSKQTMGPRWNSPMV